MNKFLNTLSLLACFAALSGCMTFVDGKKATTADQEGIEYSLPVPVIRVTPMPDGTVSVAVDMMPDPDNTYRLKTTSVVSSYTLDVVRENGMLKSVSLDAKSDAVAAAMIEARGRYITAKAEDEVKDKTAVATAAKEQAKAISDANKALALAKAKRNVMTDKSKPEDVEKADIEVAQAQATLDLLKSASTGGALASMDVVAGSTEKKPLSAAPVLFRVVPEPDTGGVRMVAFEGMDKMLATSFAAKAEAPKTPEPKLNLQLDPAGSGLVKGKALVLKITANKAGLKYEPNATSLVSVLHVDKELKATNITSVTAGPSSDAKSTVFNIVLDNKTPADSYILTLTVVMPDGQPAQGNQIPFSINTK